MGSEPGPMGWRVGRSLGRTIYHDNVFMGIMETAELAELIVTMLQEGAPGWDAGLFSARLVRPREFHQAMSDGALGVICVCGEQWLSQAGRCTTQQWGSGL